MKNPSEYKTGDQTQARLDWMLKDALRELTKVKKLTGRRLRELRNVITLLREPEIVDYLLLRPPEFTYHLHELGAA
jgi:hypothetical protein